MKRLSMLGILGLLLVGSATVSAQKLDFSGSWTMDRARSFGMPGNMNQTMSVAQSGDELQVETKLIQPNNERTVKDTYLLDGKERDFIPPVPPECTGQCASANRKADRILDARQQGDFGRRSDYQSDCKWPDRHQSHEKVDLLKWRVGYRYVRR